MNGVKRPRKTTTPKPRAKHEPEPPFVIASKDDGRHIGRVWVILRGESDVRTG